MNETYAYTDADLAVMTHPHGGNLDTKLVKDQPYSVNMLLREMIIHSDNIAKYLLVLHYPKNDLDDVYSELGIQIHSVTPYTYTIPTRTYSLFFRVLYNATFLNWDMSERALSLLNETEYKNGLIAGIPANVKTAHKFGYYTAYEGNKITSIEVHDCGIIYYPKHPYVLCIMTRGYDTHELEPIIQNISKMIYEFFDKKYAA